MWVSIGVVVSDGFHIKNISRPHRQYLSPWCRGVSLSHETQIVYFRFGAISHSEGLFFFRRLSPKRYDTPSIKETVFAF